MRGTFFIALIVAAVALLLISGCATNITTMHEGETTIRQVSFSTLGAKQEEGAGSVNYTWLGDGSGDLAVNGSAIGQDGKLTPEEAAALGGLLLKVIGTP